MQNDPRAVPAPHDAARRLPSLEICMVVGAYLLAVALFAPFDVIGDGTFYYDFTRRLLGDGGVVYAYQWGTSVWDAPFYAVGHLIDLPYDVPAGHATGQPFRDASISAAGGVAAIGAVVFSRAAVLRLGLTSNVVLLLGALFGTELWFYGVFEPSYAHAVDALVFSAVCYLVVRIWQGSSRVLAGLLGAVLVFLVSVRYANAAALPGLLLPIACRRDGRTAAHVALGGAASAVLLLAFPLALGAGFGHTADLGLSASRAVSITGGRSLDDLLIPLRMLFSVDRGLFAYAPLCGVGLVGFVVAASRPTANRIPIIGIGVAALGILWAYVVAGDHVWPGGSLSYGQRFLTSLTPVTLIGLAELARRTPRMTAALVVICTAWSLFVGLNFAYGWSGVTNDRRNVDNIVRLYTSGDRTLPDFGRLVASRIRERFAG